MKALNTKEIAAKTPADIAKLLGEKRESLRLFRFGGAGAKTKNVKEGRAIRKDIARLMTILQGKATK